MNAALPARELLRTIPNVEDVDVPGSRPYAAQGIAGGVPLLGTAALAAYIGWPDIVAYLFGLAGFGAIVGGVIAAARQDAKRIDIAKAAIAIVPSELLAHATLDPAFSEKTRILIANHLNNVDPGWHARLDSDSEDWQNLKAAGSNMASCFRSCGGGCAPKR